MARRHADDLAVIARAQLRLPAAVVELEALVPAFMLAGLARRHKHRGEGRARTPEEEARAAGAAIRGRPDVRGRHQLLGERSLRHSATVKTQQSAAE